MLGPVRKGFDMFGHVR